MADLDTQIRIAILDSFTAPLKKLGLELGAVGAQAKDASSRFQLAGNLNQAAEGMSRFSSTVLGALRKPIEEFASLDAALAKVSAKTGEERGSSLFEQLKKQAVDLGAATKYSAEQVAGAQAEFAASGRSPQEILKALPTTLSLATAGAIELGRASEITNEVLNQFNLTAEQTAHVQDVLARADEVSAASVQGLGEALSYAGGTAARLKIPLETTSALLAVLANAGQKGSTGGTNLNAFLSSIVAPSKRAKDALHGMGLSLKQIQEIQTKVATGKITEAIDALAVANAKLDPRKSAEFLDKIFGEQGGRAASVLFRASLDTSDKGLDSLVEKFNHVDGAVARTAKTMENSLAGSLERAGGAISGFTTQLGEIMAPTVKDLASLTEGAADGMRQLAIKYPDATKASLQLVAGLGAVALGMKTLLLTMSAYQGGMGALEASFKTLRGSLVGQIGLVAAVGAASFAIGTWLNELFGISDKIGSFANGGPQGIKKGQERDQVRGGVAMRDGLVAPGGVESLFKVGYYNKPGVGRTYGRHLEIGDDAPAIVKEAFAAGNTDEKSINEYIRRKRVARAGLGGGGRGGAPVSLYREEGMYPAEGPMKWPGGPRAMVPGPAETDDIATKEQTAVLERSIQETNELLKRQLEELRKQGRGMPRAGGSGAGEGAF